MTFEEIDMYFGCQGVINEKPEPIKYYNPFIYKGKIEISPGGQEGHYIDSRRYYHMHESRTRTPKQVNHLGFVVQTRSSGEYEARVYFVSTERCFIARLCILVEGHAEKGIKCICHKNCFLQPANPKDKL